MQIVDSRKPRECTLGELAEMVLGGLLDPKERFVAEQLEGAFMTDLYEDDTVVFIAFDQKATTGPVDGKVVCYHPTDNRVFLMDARTMVTPVQVTINIVK